MRIVVAAVVAVLACWTVTTAADEKPIPFPDCKCQLTFPKDWKPVSIKDSEKPKNPKTAMTAGKAESPDGKAVFAVITMTIKDLAKDQHDKLFNSAFEAAKKPEGSTAKAPEPVKADGFDFAKEFIVTSKDMRQVRTRMLIKGETVYTLVIGGEKDYAGKDEAKAILESFEPVPKK